MPQTPTAYHYDITASLDDILAHDALVPPTARRVPKSVRRNTPVYCSRFTCAARNEHRSSGFHGIKSGRSPASRIRNIRLLARQKCIGARGAIADRRARVYGDAAVVGLSAAQPHVEVYARYRCTRREPRRLVGDRQEGPSQRRTKHRNMASRRVGKRHGCRHGRIRQLARLRCVGNPVGFLASLHPDRATGSRRPQCRPAAVLRDTYPQGSGTPLSPAFMPQS